MRRSGQRGSSITGERQRQEISQLAARLLIDGEAEDFGSAKRKAALQIGASEKCELPDNLAIHAAIIENQRMFDGAATAARTVHLRRAALRAMYFLSAFQPRLVGPVFYGTPFAHSPVTLHLFSDECEAVVRVMLNAGIPYHLTEQTRKAGRRELEHFPVLETAMDQTDFELVVMPLVRLLHPPLSPIDGKPYRRMDALALAALLDSSGAGEPCEIRGR